MNIIPNILLKERDENTGKAFEFFEKMDFFLAKYKLLKLIQEKVEF